jgi:hypothetical protein
MAPTGGSVTKDFVVRRLVVRWLITSVLGAPFEVFYFYKKIIKEWSTIEVIITLWKYVKKINGSNAQIIILESRAR